MAIIIKKIEIDNEKIFTQLVNNNFYIPKLADFIIFSIFFMVINKDMLQFWHLKLGHLSKLNIFYLAKVSKGINLSKPSFSDICGFYTKIGMKVKRHKDLV